MTERWFDLYEIELATAAVTLAKERVLKDVASKTAGEQEE